MSSDMEGKADDYIELGKLTFEEMTSEILRLRAQLAANKAVRTAAEGALEEALRSFMCTQDPTIYPAGHWSHRALAIRAAMKGGPNAEV